MNLLEHIMIQVPYDGEITLRTNSVNDTHVVVELKVPSKKYRCLNGLPRDATDEEFIELVTWLIYNFNTHGPI